MPVVNGNSSSINTIYRFGFWYKYSYVCIVKFITMSRELLEFSDLIDEHFNMDDTEPDNFWQQLVNMFI